MRPRSVRPCPQNSQTIHGQSAARRWHSSCYLPVTVRREGEGRAGRGPAFFLSTGPGARVLGCWVLRCWCSGAGALVLVLWCWCSGAGALVLVLWRWDPSTGAPSTQHPSTGSMLPPERGVVFEEPLVG